MSSSFGVPHLGPWDTISSVRLNDLHTVTKYRSPDTGLQLVHAKIDGPNVHAYCIIAHKCEDHCGIPNVLNHMIWHGSKRYPHPGLLQRIATKCFSTAPEAKTEKDHSSYKFSTAGTQGFSMFLPVFFDHIFNPLLQEAVFIAEVYHIDGNGQDGGTCFNSMKRSENDPDELSSEAVFESVFGANSSYSMSHNGKATLFRSDCNLEKVRQFHEKYFHASNCCFVVVGDIEKEDLFRALAPVVHSALRSHRVRPIWVKPWMEEEDPILDIPETTIHQVEFPYSFIERQSLLAHAHVKIGLVGPPTLEQNNRCTAIRLLLQYLVNGPILASIAAIIPNQCSAEGGDEGFTFPTPSNPDSTLISFTEHQFKNSLYTLNLTNVPAEVVPTIPALIRKVITTEAKRKTFPLRKMVKIVCDYYQKDLDTIEFHVEDKIFRAVVGDFLYSSLDNDMTFDRRLNSIYEIHHFLSQNGDFWKEIIQTDLLCQNWVTVIAIPSQGLYEKVDDDMKERIDWRMGNDNMKYMKRWAQRLRTASRMLSRSPPVEYLTKYPLPSADSIGLTKIHRQENPSWANDTICNLYVDDIDSNYAYLTVMMDTSELNIDQKRYLPLFAEELLQAPYMDSTEKFHTAKEMEKEIMRDVLNYETFFGLEECPCLENAVSDGKRRFSYGPYPHILSLRLQMEVTKVKEGFFWAQTLLWNTKWHAEKLREVSIKLIKVAEEMQNDGKRIAQALMTDTLYHTDSVPRCINFLRQKFFLKGIADELPKSIRKVSKILETIRLALLRPENVTVHFAASIPRMEFHLTENPDAKFAISELFRTTFNYADWNWDYETKRLCNVPDCKWMRNREFLRKCCSEQAFPMVMKNPSSFLLQTAPGVSSCSDPDYAVILLSIEYFVQVPNGPLYKEVVEPGLAESLDIRVSPLERMIYFELNNCPDLPMAYSRIYDVMTRYLFETRNANANGEGDGMPEGTPSFHWDNFLLQSAKSSLIFKLTQMENNPMKMGFHSLASYYKEMPLKSGRDVMDSIIKVSMKQLQTVARRYFYPLFLQPNTCAATVPHDRIYAIIDSLLQRCGKKLSVAAPLEQSPLACMN